MFGRVPLARRNLFQDRRRAGLSVAGVGVALLLVLVLQSIFAGVMHQVTAYPDGLSADVVVSQRGVRTMHMSASALPPETVAQVREVPGVGWAEAIRFTTAAVSTPAGRHTSYVIGFDTSTNRAGPSRVVSGRLPGRGEAVLDEVAAGQLGVDVGDSVRVMGRPIRLSGLSTGGTSIVNTTLFVRTEDLAELRGDAVSYVLAAARGVDARTVQARVAAALPGATVQTRAQFSRSEASIVADMTADTMRIMTVIGLAIALAIIALALYTLTLGKLREYGVVKALGARTARLAAIVVGQATWTVLAALATAAVLTVVVGAVIERVQPTMRIDLVPWNVVRTGVNALALGILGAVIPLRRLVRVDPASAFRRAS